MATIEHRELTEPEAVTALETIGDTPSSGVFIDGELFAVCPGDMDGSEARALAAAMTVRDDTIGGA